MSNISSKALSSFKYVYLIVFFTLLSGIFYPLITDTSFEPVISGILVLFLGLAGGVLLYKTTTSETKREIFFVSWIYFNWNFYIFDFSTYWKSLNIKV